MKEASDQVKQLAQANAEDNPDLDKPLVQQEIAETLTAEPQKQKKSKTVAPTDQATRSLSKAPVESRTPAGPPNPKESPPTTCGEGQLNGGNALASLCRELIGGLGRDGTAANPVDVDLAEHPTTTGSSSNNNSIRCKIDMLTDWAFAAEKAGNVALAEQYFAICEGLTKPKSQPTSGAQLGPSASPAVQKPSMVAVTIPISPVELAQAGRTKAQAPLPLTIFNKVWQDKAILHYSQKRSQADKTNVDKDRYTGYPYPCKYTQTYAEWSINHQGFYTALIKVANYPKFAGWLLLHKRHCDQLVTQHGFMTRLCYDINVRTNAFAHQIKMPNKSISISNILVFNDTIARCRKFDETEFMENPYIKGVPRKAWDPVTGTVWCSIPNHK
ncbi:hypothetical protein PTTG_06771 [Puccinia triticina 1-1 BBBD Race 1]|uniref:Uncharacterized protein n=1 Tax=Puccinia triticina (isolate 1-1 / race 1 (BBBD)) TaxID=630390 RepID=A0A180G165_PUCT1|nr:hypothetical protein PTTG_06771 [Puccinia triticina 1-1 BBBD Race 1]